MTLPPSLCRGTAPPSARVPLLLALAALAAFAALAGGAPRAQQLGIGSAAPELAVTDWVKGPAVDLGAARGEQIVVLEFWATWCGPCVASIPHLSALQERYGRRGVRIVGVASSDPKLRTVERFVQARGDEIGFAVAFDGEHSARAAYMKAAAEPGIPCCFVIDKDGRIAWIGHPTALAPVLDALCEGTWDIAFERLYRAHHQDIERALRTQDWRALAECADELLAVSAGNARAWELKFLAHASLKKDPVLAERTAELALRAMAKHPAQTARFCDRTLLHPDVAQDYSELALAAMTPIAANAPDDVDVQTTWLRALDLCGKTSEARAAAERILDRIADDRHRLRALADLLVGAKHPRALADPALRAIDLALALGPESTLLLRTRFRVLNEAKDDRDAAEKTGRRLVAQMANNADQLNTFAWDLLTEEPTKGRFAALALAAAEALERCEDGRQYHMLDTIALAKFENGLIDEAIELQRKAILTGGRGDPDYAARLERYLEARRRRDGK